MRADSPDRQKGELTIRFTGDEAATLYAFLVRNEGGHGRYRANHVAELIVFDRLIGVFETSVSELLADDSDRAMDRLADEYGEWLDDLPPERHLDVAWHHQNRDEPVRLYSEIDANGYEVRKVEVYADGGMDYAVRSIETGNTRLGTVPVPPLDEINRDPQFKGRELTFEEFEAIWQAAIRRERPRGHIRVVE